MRSSRSTNGEAQSENLLKSTQAIGQALSTAKTDNPATVGSEIARQVGGIAPALDQQPAQARGAGGGMAREARLRPAEEPRTVGGEGAAMTAKRPRRTTTRRLPALLPLSVPLTTTATTSTTAVSLPADVLIDWDEVCRVSVDPALLAVPGIRGCARGCTPPRLRREAAPEVEPAGSHALGFPALAEDDPAALVETPGLRDVLGAGATHAATAAHGAVVGRVGGSRDQAAVFTLSESSIAWMLSSVENFVGFLRGWVTSPGRPRRRCHDERLWRPRRWSRGQ